MPAHATAKYEESQTDSLSRLKDSGATDMTRQIREPRVIARKTTRSRGLLPYWQKIKGCQRELAATMRSSNIGILPYW